MAGVVCLGLEGTLAKTPPTTRLTSSSPLVLELALLYHSLAPIVSVILLCNTMDKRLLDWWLHANNLTSHATVLLGVAGNAPGANTRAIQLQRLRAQGTQISLVIDSDPETIKHTAGQGLVGMHCVNPITRTFPPGRRRPWGEIVDNAYPLGA